MNKSTFSGLHVLDAGIEVISLFEAEVAPFHEMILCNEKQSQQLAARRDALLSRLVPGELRMLDATQWGTRTDAPRSQAITQ